MRKNPLLFKTIIKEIALKSLKLYHRTMNTPKAVDEINGVRDYQVMASGHGSSYRFDGLDPKRPTLPNITLLAACIESIHWELTADTIGGRAQIYRVSTKEIIDLEKAIGMVRDYVTEHIDSLSNPEATRALKLDKYQRSLRELFAV